MLGLLGYAAGALSMALAQNVITIVICWAILGGLGASLLLPSMQSLIHGNFEGDAQKQAYALVGAPRRSRRRRPADRRLHHDLSVVARRVLLEAVVIAGRAVGHRPGPRRAVHRARQIDLVGAILSVVGMGGIVLGILVWQEGGRVVGVDRCRRGEHGRTGWWLVRRKRAASCR